MLLFCESLVRTRKKSESVYSISISVKWQNNSYLQRNQDEETIFSIKKVVVHSLSLISLKVLTVHIVCNLEKLLLSISRTDIYHTCYKEIDKYSAQEDNSMQSTANNNDNNIKCEASHKLIFIYHLVHTVQFVCFIGLLEKVTSI